MSSVAKLLTVSVGFLGLFSCGPQAQETKTLLADLEPAAVAELAAWPGSDWHDVPVPLPQSVHPYRNHTLQDWEIEAPECVQSLRIQFDRIDLEYGYDAIYVLDAEGSVAQTITGSHRGLTSFPVNGRSLTLRLKSDFSITDWGFNLERIEAFESPMPCPKPMLPACPEGTVAVTAPRTLCECPPMPVCAALDDFAATYQTYGGPDRMVEGHRILGDGSFYLVHGDTSLPDKTLIAQSHGAPVQHLAQALVDIGFFDKPGTVGPVDEAGWTTALTATFNGRTHTRTWLAPQGVPFNPPQELGAALTAWKQLGSCNDGSDDQAVCADGVTCHDTRCAPLTCGDTECAAGESCTMETSVSGHPGYPQYPLCSHDPSACICTEQFDPVCGNDGVAYSNACFATCAGVTVAHPGKCGIAGDPCGGPDAMSCQGPRYLCRYDLGRFEPNDPSEFGTCVQDGYCEGVPDCERLPRTLCSRHWYWTCETNSCRYHCEPYPEAPWESMNVALTSGSPYANNQELAWRVTAPAGSDAMRFDFTAFDLEDDYDFVTLYDVDGNELQSYTGALGPFTTDTVEHTTVYVIFKSDGSVTGPGFSIDRIDFRQPAQ